MVGLRLLTGQNFVRLLIDAKPARQLFFKIILGPVVM